MNLNFELPDTDFSDFFSIEKLSSITNYFFNNGAPVKGNRLKRIYIVPGRTTIYDVDEHKKQIPTFQYYPDDKELDFIDNYLMLILHNSKKHFINDIDKKLDNEMTSPQSKKHYLTINIDKLQEFINLKFNLKFYIEYESFSIEVDKVLCELIDELERKIPNCFSDFNQDKIKFKLSKKEVCILFKKISDLGFLHKDQSSDKELGLLLEKHFMYLNEKSKTYENITNADKYLNKLVNDPRYHNPSLNLAKLLK